VRAAGGCAEDRRGPFTVVKDWEEEGIAATDSGARRCRSSSWTARR
jgi:hypothetical protein